MRERERERGLLGDDDEQDNEEEDEEEGREVRGLEQRRRAITLALFEIWWFGNECVESG